MTNPQLKSFLESIIAQAKNAMSADDVYDIEVALGDIESDLRMAYSTLEQMKDQQ